MVRRSKLEIYLDVLWTIKKGDTKPTRIMYGANLSWKPLHESLSILISKGLIIEERVKNSKRYRITDKGHNALSYHRSSLEGLVESKIRTYYSI